MEQVAEVGLEPCTGRIGETRQQGTQERTKLVNVLKKECNRDYQKNNSCFQRISLMWLSQLLNIWILI